MTLPSSERTVIEEERPTFVRYVRSLLRNRSDLDAEDVVQDVLLSVLERPDLPAAEYIAGYIFRSLRNRIIDLSRTRREMVSLNSEQRGGERLIDLLPRNAAGCTAPDAKCRVEGTCCSQLWTH